MIGVEIQLVIVGIGFLIWVKVLWRNILSNLKDILVYCRDKIVEKFSKIVGKKTAITLMADYCCTGIWNSSGMEIMYCELMVSSKLISDIKAWEINYDLNNLDWLSDPMRQFDIEEHDRVGMELAKRLKFELGNSYIVEYFNEGNSKRVTV